MFDVSSWGVSHAAVAAFAASAVAVGNWLLSFRKDKRDAHTDAIAALRASLAELRTDVDRLHTELDDEREARKRAETEVRTLRQALHAFAGALQRHNIPVPEVPGWQSPHA